MHRRLPECAHQIVPSVLVNQYITYLCSYLIEANSATLWCVTSQAILYPQVCESLVILLYATSLYHLCIIINIYSTQDNKYYHHSIILDNHKGLLLIPTLRYLLLELRECFVCFCSAVFLLFYFLARVCSQFWPMLVLYKLLEDCL